MNNEYLKETAESGVFTSYQQVDIEIYDFTDLGMNVVINDEYMGLVYDNQIYDKYYPGQKLKAYIKLVRDDGKIDVSLHPKKVTLVKSAAEDIFQHLEESGGKLSFNDKSSPEDIKREFKVSKKVFKEAIGKLYKQRRIIITSSGIETV